MRKSSPRGPWRIRSGVQLEAQVAALAGSRISATFRQDKTLIGGAIVRIGSTIYDGSVKGRLERLKERLMSN